MNNKNIVLKNGYIYTIIDQLGQGATSKVYLVIRNKNNSEQNKEIKAKTEVQDKLASSQSQQKNNQFQQSQLIYEQQKCSVNNVQQKQVEVEEDLFMSLHLKQQQFNPSKSFYFKQSYALKVISLKQQAFVAKLQKQYLLQVQLLLSLNHPGIVKIYDYNIIKNTQKQLYMLIQHGKNGNLAQLISFIHQQQFTTQQKQKIFIYYITQMLSIIQYLQNKGISHRDIKPQNFIIDDNYNLKLIDFGSSQIFDHSKIIIKKVSKFSDQFLTVPDLGKNYIGSKHFISPEMIKKSRSRIQNGLSYEKVDIWSLGVLAFYMYSYDFPFNGFNTYHILRSIEEAQPDYSRIKNEDVVEMIKMMLKKKLQQRGNIQQIKKLKLFKDIDFNTVFDNCSPIGNLIRDQIQKYFFKGQAIITIQGVSKTVILGVLRKKMMEDNNMLNNMKSVEDINIFLDFKQKFEEGLGINDNEINYKYFLTFSKHFSNPRPALLQINKNIKLKKDRNFIVLNWKNIGEERQQQNLVQIKLKNIEQSQRFVCSMASLFNNK